MARCSFNVRWQGKWRKAFVGIFTVTMHRQWPVFVGRHHLHSTARAPVVRGGGHWLTVKAAPRVFRIVSQDAAWSQAANHGHATLRKMLYPPVSEVCALVLVRPFLVRGVPLCRSGSKASLCGCRCTGLST